MKNAYASWGGHPKLSPARASAPAFRSDVGPIGPRTLPIGNLRSYGDSCQISDGTVLDMRRLDRLQAFDPATGLLRCDAGALLRDVISFAMPQGWFPPVTPGTSHVTVGGCVANDVHGKNHHAFGSFGHHVEEITLLRSDGTVLRCAADENLDMLRATIGGLGLTGVILDVALRLRPVRNRFVDVATEKFDNLSGFLDIEAASRGSEYAVSWIDVLASGNSIGRGHYMLAEHSGALEDRSSQGEGRLSFPVLPPISLINPLTLKLFNEAYYRRLLSRRSRAIVDFRKFFYPLDGILNWNRLYGPKGFLQYQCVVPRAAAKEVVGGILKQTAATGEGSFLVVLKAFGDKEKPGLLSFPRDGITLALDFPNTGTNLLRLLDRFDDAVAEAGGAVYAAKDSRMSPASFRRFYPEAERFEAFRDKNLTSSFWERVTR